MRHDRQRHQGAGAPPEQGTAKADYIKLDEMGNPIFGTTHMMMLGTNNLEIADIMLDWVARTFARRKRAKSGEEHGTSARRSRQ